MGLSKFRNNSTVFFIFTDIWTFFYIYKKFTNKERLDQLIAIAAKQQGIDSAHLEGLYTLMTQSLIMLLALASIIHIVNYVLYNKNKKAAIAYLKLYAWSAAFLLPLWGFSVFSESPPAAIIFIALGGLMAFNAMGLRVFPYQEKS
ncbi:MAG: hypothetical protein ACJAT2_002374 [Bacteriovoracaceae bacterium]|jgi:hypothetical protein